MIKTIHTVIALIMLALVVFATVRYEHSVNAPQTPSEITPTTTTPTATLSDPLNIAYTIDGRVYMLTNGSATLPSAPDATSMTTLSVFGQPVYGDLDGDGDTDAAVLLTLDGGGSGTFFYGVLALNTDGTYTSTNALFLGDRIAPQNVLIDEGRALYNYAERKIGEPMTTSPSMGKSLWINLDTQTGNIGEWVKDFEGEADTAMMNLTMKPWAWIRTEYDAAPAFYPQKADAFTLTFNADSSIAVTTDCNGMGGRYATESNQLTFTEMVSTLMYCDGSDEGTFSTMLGEVTAYHFTGKGELVLELATDHGSMFFR